MSHTSPASFLIWSVMTCLFQAFFIFHLWSFDKFKCLRWNGPSSGVFKRIMTYCYLLTAPILTVYTIGMAVIKYREGFIALPSLGVIVKPYQLWSLAHRRAIFPLQLLFSVGWSLESITHLEELCFWLFLVYSGSTQPDWFRSLYFKMWLVGSSAVVIYMPLITILTRSDPLKSEACMFLAGSLGSFLLTLGFIPVLWSFPNFLAGLRHEGADTHAIVRLTKFSELNFVRIIFRFMFAVPFLVLGTDGVRGHHHINESMFWTDLLVIVAGFGVTVSSGITLFIFFPRSIEGEIAARDAAKERKGSRSSSMNSNDSVIFGRGRGYPPSSLQSDIPLAPTRGNSYDDDYHHQGDYKYDVDERDNIVMTNLPPLRPNRKKGDVELGVMYTLPGAAPTPKSTPNASHMALNFVSPIDLVSRQPLESDMRLTFSRQ